MSDLIDFDSPSCSSTNDGLLLASPLIPAPESSRSEDSASASEAGPHFVDKRRSLENNPFDMVIKKITEYERNKEDPFERVIQKAYGRVSIESKDDFMPRHRRFNDTESSLLQENGGKENDISIITDLNNTNLIGDIIDGRETVISWDCDNKGISNVNISLTADSPDLSILNNSAMNDSLLDYDSNAKDIKLLNTDFNNRPRTLSQNNLSPKNVLKTVKRSLSVNDTLKNIIFAEENMINCTQSSIFEDPMNNAFRKVSSRSSTSFSFNYLNTQFDMSTNKPKLERLNSDSSVFSGLSNISAIPLDSFNKVGLDRFYSEGSATSGVSNLSIITPNSNISSCDSSVFSNDTVNKGFIASRSQLNLTNSCILEKSPSKSNKSDLIKKFYEIKTRMSTSQMEHRKIEGKQESAKEKSASVSEFNISQKEELEQKSEEKLIDVDTSGHFSVNDNSVNNIISHEAKLLAQTFEKMASTKDSNSSNEDDLLFSKYQWNFDYLPPSDDEAIDNLIELPLSPAKNVSTEGDEAQKQCTDIQLNVIFPEDNIKALESEFIEQKDVNKKAIAATLLLDLKQIIKVENNPVASKVLDDLQKLLGVKCDNNTEILQVCLQSTNSPEDKSNSKENVLDKNQSNDEVTSDGKENSRPFKEISENVSNDLHNSNSNLNTIQELKENLTESGKLNNEFQNKKESLGSKENLNELYEDQKLAINLLRTLNKILTKNTKDSTTDVLQNLGTVLNMATELRTKNKDKQSNSKNTKIVIDCEKKVPKQLNHSANSLHKSPSRPSLVAKSQNKSFESLSKRKSVSTNPICNNNHFVNIPFAKDKRKSHFLAVKKRFPSDPGFTNLSPEKKKSESPESKQQSNQTSSSLGTNKITKEPIKTKLKKKANSETISKKGPLKAVIPLGNMHKRTSISQKMSGLVTPPKVDSLLTVKIISSTPNSSADNKNSKSKPTASSTPNIEKLRTRSVKVEAQQNTKSKLTCNISPVSLNSSLKRSLSSPKTYIKKVEQMSSPQKRSSMPKKNSENDSESRLPRYSPQSVRVRNYSMNDLKTAESPSSTHSAGKISSEKKIQRHSVLSPLKNCNNLVNKVKPISLISRLGKPISRIQTGPEKENYA